MDRTHTATRAVAWAVLAVVLLPGVLAVPCPLLKPLREKYDFGSSMLLGELCDDWRLLRRDATDRG